LQLQITVQQEQEITFDEEMAKPSSGRGSLDGADSILKVEEV